MPRPDALRQRLATALHRTAQRFRHQWTTTWEPALDTHPVLGARVKAVAALWVDALATRLDNAAHHTHPNPPKNGPDHDDETDPRDPAPPKVPSLGTEEA